MKVIGITGGVGAGKSEVLDYLHERYGATIIKADDIGKKLQKKGGVCYQAIVDHFGEEILNEKGELNRSKLAEIIFKDEKELAAVNNMVHPAVKEEILKKIKHEERKDTNLVLVESAVLNQVAYQDFCDEVWYIHVGESARKQRLMYNRGYSAEKVEDIMASQMSKSDYLANSDRVIDNTDNFEETKDQLDKILEDF